MKSRAPVAADKTDSPALLLKPWLHPHPGTVPECQVLSVKLRPHILQAPEEHALIKVDSVSL